MFLVTGGAGFIGSHIVNALVNQKIPVRVLDNFITGKKENLTDSVGKIELVKGDICDVRTLTRVLKGVKVVIHQAALRSVPRSVDDPAATNEVNVTGTLNLFLACKRAGVKRIVYASSSSIYGNNPELPKKENHLPAPISPYAVSKLAGEHYAATFNYLFNMEVISLRYFNVFGPRQDPLSEYAAVIPRFILSALKDEPIEIHGDGNQSRDFTYIANVVQANLLAAKTGMVKTNVFNIACGERFTVNQIADTISQISGKKLKIQHTPSRPGDVRHTQADISLAKRYLKFRPQIDFLTGMKKTVNYFVELYTQSRLRK